MPAIEIKQSIDAEDIALALQALDPEQIAAFARDLMQRLFDIDDTVVEAFAAGVASERELQVAA